MKVLHVSKYYPPFFGGIENVVFDIVTNIQKHHVKCDVLCFSHNGQFSVEESEFGKVIRVPEITKFLSSPLSQKFIKELRRISGEYDIIHFHLPNPMANFAAYFMKGKAEVVSHWHCDADLKGVKQLIGYIYSPFQDWLLRKSRTIITTSPKLKDESQYLKQYREKTVVIPIGIKSLSEKVDQRQVERVRLEYPGKKIIFSLGRLVGYKGYEYLIKAAKLLPDEYVVLIGGKGPLFEELEELICPAGIKDKVKLLGEIAYEQLASYFAACDIFCFPSISCSEAFGVVQIEAMSLGKPIVGTEIARSGVSWVNQHDETGLIVPACDSGELAKAIMKICDDRVYYEQLSKNAFERFFKYFRIEDMVAATAKLYHELGEKV